ncbi:MAG: choice-of-anchor Q domain-containing protein [Anaerolineales bacterium]
MPNIAASVGIIIESNQRIGLGLPSSTLLRVYVVDTSGSPVSGVSITFTAPLSGPSGTFADSKNGTTVAVTDNNGIATTSTFTANSISGNYLITAQADSISKPTTFSLINSGLFVKQGGVDGSNTCTSPTSPCGSINQAIDKASRSETIFVAAGTYTDPVHITKDISLLGGWNSSFSTQNGISVVDGQHINDVIDFSLYNYFIVKLDHFGILNGNSNYTWAGGINGNGSLTILNSTVRGNFSKEGPGGIAFAKGDLTIVNTTVAENTTKTAGGGIYAKKTYLTILNSTIANNHARLGGGVIGEGKIILGNSILSNNKVQSYGPDCVGIDVSDHSIIGDTSNCSVKVSTGDKLNIDPLISDYPLNTPGYYALQLNSPAIDAGNATICPLTDQRGINRFPEICDIGAYEYSLQMQPLPLQW